jgi:hypothetical protein
MFGYILSIAGFLAFIGVLAFFGASYDYREDLARDYRREQWPMI